MDAIFIDARDFEQLGGWKREYQFITTMGMPYLLAAGIGTPVEAAEVKFQVPKAGKYRAWVRTRDWLPEYSPGGFHLEIGAEKSAVLGQNKCEEWDWQAAGDWELPSGENTVRLIDDTGYYGRVAALFFTTDLDFVPPADVEQIRLLKQQVTGVSTEPQEAGTYEVIVAGAGIAGCLAAIAAARQGVKVLLLDDREAPGGNALLGVPVNGATFQANIRETGLVEELARNSAYYGLSNSKTLLKMFQAEPNLTYRPYSVVEGALMQDEQTIEGVKVLDALTGQQFLFHAKMFLDCSGDSWLAYFAGAQMRRGREARAEFNEEFAPPEADGNLMSGVNFGEAFLSRAADTGKPAPYTPPAWAYRFPTEEDYSRPVASSRDYDFTGGTWFHEHHGDIDEFTHPEKARDEIIRIVLGVWDYIKNVWWLKERAENYALKIVSTTLAKRESNRIMGDYILTQNDVEQAKDFEDKIAYGGWPIDVHNHAGMFGKESPYEVSRCIDTYPIPYRCIYSKNIRNLLFAGRNISVTHIAHGTIRVQGTLAVLGEAAGTAAALCVQQALTPRQLGQQAIGQLQQLLNKHDLYIPGITNQDALDLARRAKFSASSVNACREFGKRDANLTEVIEEKSPRMLCVERGLYEKPDCIWLAVAGYKPKTEYTLTIALKGSDTADPVDLTDCGQITQPVVFGEIFPFPGGVNQYNESPFGAVKWIKLNLRKHWNMRYLWVVLPAVENLFWGYMPADPYGRFATYRMGGGQYQKDEARCQAFYLQPSLTTPGADELKQRYAPQQVVSGVNRIVGENPNMWASDMRLALPQWLEATLEQPETISCVYLAFDTNLDMNNSTSYDKRPFPCVSDYEIAVLEGKTWKTVACVQDNFQRRRIHTFAPILANKVRVTVKKTHGDKAARIFEMRIYNEKK